MRWHKTWTSLLSQGICISWGAPATPLHKISCDASSTKRVGARFSYFSPHRICGFEKIHLQFPFVLFGNKKVHIASSLVRLAYQENEHRGSLSKAIRQEGPRCYSCSLGAKIQHIFQKARVSIVEYLLYLFSWEKNLCRMLVTRFSDSSWRFSQGSQLRLFLLSSGSTFLFVSLQNPNLFHHMSHPSSPGELLSVFVFPLWLRQNIYFNV